MASKRYHKTLMDPNLRHFIKRIFNKYISDRYPSFLVSLEYSDHMLVLTCGDERKNIDSFDPFYKLHKILRSILPSMLKDFRGFLQISIYYGSDGKRRKIIQDTKQIFFEGQLPF